MPGCYKTRIYPTIKEVITLKLVYPAIFSPMEENPQGYCVEVPNLAGCVTQGQNLAQAVEMAGDAVCGWIITSIEDGEPIPAPAPISDIKAADPGSFVSLVVADMDEYSRQLGRKAVKKTLTIPQWLNTAAEKEGVNFSQLLQDALLERLGMIN